MKKSLITLVFCIMMFFPAPKAHAAFISDAVDIVISYTAKATYYITKYSLKSAWFTTKKVAKGAKILVKNTFNGTKDAFSTNPKPINKVPQNSIQPISDFNEEDALPPIPDANIPVITY